VSLTTTELRDWLSTRVARHQMPKSIEFREDLPTTPLGKLDTSALQRGCDSSGMHKADDPGLP
jgi:non-ribosomal peptide synthetase component E (peptide arylation enzyme)